MLALVLPKLNIEKAPPFTTTIRDVYNVGSYTLVMGLVPPPLVDKYINWFNADPVLIVRGYEYLDFERLRSLYGYPAKRWNRGLVAPDVYDLVLIQGRLRDPFARPVKIYREARRRDLSLLKVSEQVLSYHFNKHVKTMWKGNTAIVFSDMRVVPVRIFYFEGKDAPTFARILCQLPGSFGAVIDVNKALLIGQLPCSYDEYIMRGAEGFDVEMPFSYFIQSSTDMRKVMPRFWKYVENNKWVFKEKLYVLAH